MIKDKSIQNRKEKDCSCAGEALTSLEHTVARLRAPDGCPWDRVQTHESIKAACVEEAAEVLCGINILSETGDPRSLREELGDLLFQVVMHAQMAEEEGLFTLEDVIRGVNEKMLRRHPHVFGEERKTRCTVKMLPLTARTGLKAPVAPVMAFQGLRVHILRNTLQKPLKRRRKARLSFWQIGKRSKNTKRKAASGKKTIFSGHLMKRKN